jgi:hypothetical protein
MPREDVKRCAAGNSASNLAAGEKAGRRNPQLASAGAPRAKRRHCRRRDPNVPPARLSCALSPVARPQCRHPPGDAPDTGSRESVHVHRIRFSDTGTYPLSR